MREQIITADLHTHLLEKKTKPAKYWEFAQKACLNAIAITEHSEYNPKKAYLDVLAKKPEDLLLIPGMEMSTSHGHIVALGESEEIYDFPELQQKGVKLEKAYKIANENDILLSFAHPWGFDYDSVVYLQGLSQLRHYAIHGNMGAEAYNGMIGELAESLVKSNWVRKPMGFFAYLEKNKLLKTAGISRIMAPLNKKLNKQALDIVQRNLNAMSFGEEAKFITAGSDAHSADRIGCGIIKVKVIAEKIDNRAFLHALRDKSNVLWAGPPAFEIGDGVFAKRKQGVKRMEVLAGLKYAAKKVILRRRPKRIEQKSTKDKV
ncbi:MAG: hypothetical protein Q7R70_02230 [Candidatus Diapherotrites archaeon]|nr:hypothetical protein [Candidatus Diapherotrites archaeon]